MYDIIVIFWFSISVPLLLESSISYIGNATVFLSMILLGAAVSRSFSLSAFCERSDAKFFCKRSVAETAIHSIAGTEHGCNSRSEFSLQA